MSSYENVAVLIPCYNESITIATVIKDFKQALPECKIYIYDNNSTDNTDVVARNNGAVVCYERRQGKGNVIRRMFREIEADCYILVDGDDTYSAQNAPEMVQKVWDGYDMVVGDRLSSSYFNENKRPFHNFGNSLVRFAINTLFGSEVKDVMTGYRAFSRLFVKSYPVLSKGFEIETEMTIHAIDKNMAMCNVVVGYKDRPQGSVSKLNTFKDGFKVLKTILRLFILHKPLLFWGLISCISGIVELFLRSDFCITVLFLVTGVVLQVLKHKEKTAFEQHLLIIQKRE